MYIIIYIIYIINIFIITRHVSLFQLFDIKFYFVLIIVLYCNLYNTTAFQVDFQLWQKLSLCCRNFYLSQRRLNLAHFNFFIAFLFYYYYLFFILLIVSIKFCYTKCHSLPWFENLSWLRQILSLSHIVWTLVATWFIVLLLGWHWYLVYYTYETIYIFIRKEGTTFRVRQEKKNYNLKKKGI